MTILKKRQIVALSLIIMIVVAGYLQYTYNNSGSSKTEEEEGRLGEAVYVDNTDLEESSEDTSTGNVVVDEIIVDTSKDKETSSGNVVASKEANDYFAQVKLEREIARSKETDKLGSIASEESASAEIREKAYEKMMALIDIADKEMKIEALIKKEGFEDVVAFFAEDGSIDIIVKAPSLSQAQVSQIADIVTRHAGVGLDKVTVKHKY
ncbi:MAG TPA: SpoIIIAH-like family protein [Clostridiaceae bacterium]|nr:SpoIIIAH-like family protein [Clostridiaceae bacterium]